MKTITRGWPPARRAAQRERIMARKPWLKSTGPRTAAGKACVRFNGLKHNRRSAAWHRLKNALRLQRQYIQALNHQRREEKSLVRLSCRLLNHSQGKLILQRNKPRMLPTEFFQTRKDPDHDRR